MILNDKSSLKICFLVLIALQDFQFNGCTHDQTTQHANTLQDNADDIQKQLDNEARDRFKYGQPKTMWVFHFPVDTKKSQCILDVNQLANRYQSHVHPPRRRTLAKRKDRDLTVFWNYKDQMSWPRVFPSCKGTAQSPINLPVEGLVKARGARPLNFFNYKCKPKYLSLQNDGNRVTIQGEWNKKHWPVVYGGAAHSRRYLFHSMTVHWPSEHTVGGLYFPLETQLLHVSAEYASFDDALKAYKRDQQALLGITTIYQFSKTTHAGLQLILKALRKTIIGGVGVGNVTMAPMPLNVFSPPFKRYACYPGSIPYPPCTESVIWFVRSKTLGVTREDSEKAMKMFHGDTVFANKLLGRHVQPTNDRTILLFH